MVEEGSGWERARENVKSWGWGAEKKALESLEGGTVVKGENIKITW